MLTLNGAEHWQCANRVAQACGVTRYRLLGAGAAGLVRTRVHKGRVLYHRDDALGLFGPADADGPRAA